MKGLTAATALERVIDILPLLLVAVVGTVLLELLVFLFFSRVLKSKYALPYTLVAPAAVALALFTLYPFVYNIRLAFSDLRLKTISCYIPDSDITNAPCSLGQAALNAEVQVDVDNLVVRVEPLETAPIAFTLDEGETVLITGRSKAVGYVVETGFATLEGGGVCNPLDTACIAAQRERQAAIENQDQRDWWEIETEDGQSGWIANNKFFMTDAAQIYEEPQAGGEILASVADGEEVRLIRREGLEWYQIRTADGTEGWVNEAPRQRDFYVAAQELVLYDAQGGEPTEDTLAAGQEVRLLRQEPIIWSLVSYDDQQVWVNIDLSVVEFYEADERTQVYAAPDPNQKLGTDREDDADASAIPDETDVQIPEGESVRIFSTQPEMWYQISLLDGTLGWTNIEPATAEAFNFPDDATLFLESDGAEAVGSVDAGDQVEVLGSTNIEGVVWYRVRTAEGIEGWAEVEPLEFTEIIVLPEPAFLFGEPGGGALVFVEPPAIDESAEPLPAGTPVQQLTSQEVTWYEVQISEATEEVEAVIGWVSTEPAAINEAYFAPSGDDSVAYTSFADTADTAATIPAGTELNVVETRERIWYQVNPETGAAWTPLEPAEIYSTVTVPAETQVYADPVVTAEVLGAAGSGEVEQLDRVTAYWYQIRAYGDNLEDDAFIDGWVSVVPNERVTTEREIVLYSLEYGWRNFKRVFVDEDPATGEIRGWGRLLQTENSTFPRLMRTTILWTTLNVMFHLIFGMTLALMLNKEGLQFKGLYRAIIILPWAIPQVIIALTWRGEFNFQFGFVNKMLIDLGMEPVEWLRSAGPAFAAVTFVNIWLGIPFYMVTLLGGLQSISGDYYEAASIDGANAFERFRNITIPLIRPVAVPIVTLDVIWTFNNFNVIYLITEGQPNESTNILVTALYNAAFGRNGQFQLGFAAAFSLVIFVVLFLFALVWVTQSGALKSVYDK